MLFLLSPAKSLDYDTPVPAPVAALATVPQFLARSSALIDVLQQMSVGDIATLMNVSHPLATLNVERFQSWSLQFTPANSRPAVLAFNGDVYDGLQARSLSRADLRWAQQHLAILSGLYGVLRPLDLLQPYRLEMGTALDTDAGRDLYDFWGDALVEHLNERAASDRSPVIVNLASQEYFRSVRRPALRARVVDCVFEDWKGGGYKIISFYAKRARGLMARHAVQRRVATPAGLKAFAADGYAYAADASAPDRLVFRRRREAAPEPVAERGG